jgi:chaperonin GroEL (HSP60 family)
VDDVAIVAKSGRGVYETRFFDGVVVDREVLDELPTEVKNAKIALLDFPIEHKEPKLKGRKELKEEGARKRSKAGQTLGAVDFHISLSKPSLMKEFMDKRGEIFDEIIDPIIESGANVVCCRWGVDDDALGKFQKAGIMLLKRVKLMDLKRLERSTGAEIASDVEDLGVGVEKLGFAGRVVQREIGDVKYVSFEECPHKKSSAIIIRGASDRVLEGVVGEIKSALHCVALLMEDRRVVPGGGAVEMECASELRKFAKTIPSKEQIAINSFADALESIPMAIAKNSGMNPLDALVELRAEHSAGNRNAGISGRDKKVKDLIETGIIEPLRVKLQAFISATDAAIEMLKIDDLHIAKSKEREEEEKKHPIERKPPELMGIERKPTPFRYYKGGRVKY